MRMSMLVVSLVAVACSKSGNKVGGDDAAAETQPPKVWIEAGQGLPSGDSSADSLDIKVSGNETATEYAYSFFSDTSVTCAAANYGVFNSISTPLTEIDLGGNGAKIICIKGKDAQDEEQAEPKRYEWTKIDGTAVDEQTPEASLETQPVDGPSEKISSMVEGNDVTVKYQYALISEEDYDCAGIDADANVNYNPPQAMDAVLEQDIGANGHKTLCLLGLDEYGQLQDPAKKYTWEKTAPVMSDADEQPAAGEAGIRLSNASITFRSGTGNGIGFTVKNVGASTLKWEANTASAVPWLTIKMGTNYQALTAGKLAEGQLAAGASAPVFFKLSQGRGTDYGAPYKREHEIVFTNKDSGHEIKAKIALEIPKLEVPMRDGSPVPVHVKLTRDSAPIKVYAKNLNKSLSMRPIEIDVVPGFPTSITKNDKKARYNKFKSLVTVGKPKPEITGANMGQKYIEFTVTAAGKTSCEAVRQTLYIYSNGDSKGADDCDVKARQRYIGMSHDAKWTTKRCLRIMTTFNAFDMNDDDVINVLDLTFIGDKVNKSPPNPMTAAYRRADVDGNGRVERADLGLLSKCFGTRY